MCAKAWWIAQGARTPHQRQVVPPLNWRPAKLDPKGCSDWTRWQEAG